jgi:hypothetical protein
MEQFLTDLFNTISNLLGDGFSLAGIPALMFLVGLVIGSLLKESEVRKLLNIPSDHPTIMYIAKLLELFSVEDRIQLYLNIGEEMEAQMIEEQKAKLAKKHPQEAVPMVEPISSVAAGTGPAVETLANPGARENHDEDADLPF